MANNVSIGVGTKGVAQASSELDKLRDKFDKIQKQGAKGFGIGVGAAATAAAFNVVGQAAGGLYDVLKDSVSAAIAEEKSIQKLGTALEANVPNWDGNTKAIEKTLQARMKLGFSDDEQRESLALLVAATHDANKALEVQRTAMDLARLKGISLAEASQALVKVEGGQYRMLKSLGIQLPKNADAEAALAAVQKVAFGQAADYANTTAGKLEVAQVAVGEAMEKFGTAILPVVAEALGTVAAGATDVGNVLDVLNKGLPKSADESADLTTSLLDLAAVFNPVMGASRDAAKQMADDLHQTTDNADYMSSHVKDDMAMTSDQFANLGDQSKDTARDVTKSNEKMIGSVEELRDAYMSAIEKLIADYFDPLQEQQDLDADIAERTALRKELAEKKMTKDARREANQRLTDLDRSILETRVKLLEAGRLNAKEQAALLHELEHKLTQSKGKARAAIQGIIDKVRQLNSLTGKGIKVTVTGSHAGSQFSAKGGPAYGPTVVGEHGPELVDLPAGSRVHTAQDTKDMMGGSGTVQNFNLTVLGDVRAKDESSILATMRRLKGIGTTYPIPGVLPS